MFKHLLLPFMNWRKLNQYRSEVLGNLMALTLMFGEEGRVLEKDDNISEAIKLNFESCTPSSAASIYIAATIMSKAIEESADATRKLDISQKLSDWSALDIEEQRAMRKSLQAGTLDQDMLLTRCQWLLLMGQDFLLEEKITMHDFRVLKDSIYGPMQGDAMDDRRDARFDDMISNILD